MSANVGFALMEVHQMPRGRVHPNWFVDVAPPAVGRHGRQDVARCLWRVVQDVPGIGVIEAIERVRQDVPAQAAFASAVLRDLTRQGLVVRHAWGRRHCLFPATIDVALWWKQVAALRDQALRVLYDLLRTNTWTTAEACHELQQRLAWNASTTKARIQRLREAGLVKPQPPGKRNTPLNLIPLHPAAQKALQYHI